MSRIEEAIEKALRQRGETAAPAAPARELAIARPAQTYDPTDGVHIKTDSPYIVALNQPNTPIAEEYRKLKSMVVSLTGQGTGFHNTIMVTSTLGAEGKSITSLNLAITLSKDFDYTVLLVDADIRKPTIHRLMGLEPAAGLTECLAGEKDIADAIIKTDIGKLSFLPAGKKVDNPVELLSSQKMRDFVTGIKGRYPDRYIIIDTPPILPFAETRAVSSMVDGVLFVVRERAAAVKDIQEAVGLLKGKLLGIVYNGVSPMYVKHSQQYYYNY